MSVVELAPLVQLIDIEEEVVTGHELTVPGVAACGSLDTGVPGGSQVVSDPALLPHNPQESLLEQHCSLLLPHLPPAGAQATGATHFSLTKLYPDAQP